MKRFLVFGGDVCYAIGGMADFLGSFDTEADAAEFALGFMGESEMQWFHIYDRSDNIIVRQSDYGAYGFDRNKDDYPTGYHKDINVSLSIEGE